MFQDMEISKALAEVFESKPEAKEILEDSAAESWSCVAHWGIGGRIHVPQIWCKEIVLTPWKYSICAMMRWVMIQIFHNRVLKF